MYEAANDGSSYQYMVHTAHCTLHTAGSSVHGAHSTRTVRCSPHTPWMSFASIGRLMSFASIRTSQAMRVPPPITGRTAPTHDTRHDKTRNDTTPHHTTPHHTAPHQKTPHF
ncbi:hypothetical protein PMIN03_005117 [Paraphaeosphaeria minitans]